MAVRYPDETVTKKSSHYPEYMDNAKIQRVEKENAIVKFAQNYIKSAVFKTFHRNVLKGKLAENC